MSDSIVDQCPVAATEAAIVELAISHRSNSRTALCRRVDTRSNDGSARAGGDCVEFKVGRNRRVGQLFVIHSPNRPFSV
jgi:hypothetical protein